MIWSLAVLLWVELFQILLQNSTWPSGKERIELTSPSLMNTTFFACWFDMGFSTQQENQLFDFIILILHVYYTLYTKYEIIFVHFITFCKIAAYASENVTHKSSFLRVALQQCDIDLIIRASLLVQFVCTCVFMPCANIFCAWFSTSFLALAATFKSFSTAWTINGIGNNQNIKF